MTTDALPSTADTGGWAGHPRGLSTLFFTEMWERFSYYGMRAFLILYMVAPAAAGGLGLRPTRTRRRSTGPTPAARGAPAILGGLVADRLLGQYRTRPGRRHHHRAGPLHAGVQGAAVVLHRPGARSSLGTGLLKPNVSTLVGALYEPGDARRDAGFSIFYMGINWARCFGPLVAGYLAQRVGLARRLRLRRRRHGVRPRAVRGRTRPPQAGLDRLAADERHASSERRRERRGRRGFSRAEW